MSSPKPQRTDGRSGRFYEIDGEKYPSVTTILQAINKPALIPWAAKVERELVLEVSCELYSDSRNTPEMSKTAWLTTMQTRLGKAKASQRELAKAGEIGSQVHSLVEWTLRAELCEKAGPSPSISDKAQWSFMAWEDWRKSVNLKPIFVEATVWSRKYAYAGTMDLLAEVNGELTVLDWKTGKAIYPESFLQNAAYRNAIREMGHADPVKGLIVRLPKVETDPDFEVADAGDEAYHLERFLNVKDTWHWIQKCDEAYEAKKEQKEQVAAHA